MHVLLLGPPGSGKGTRAKRLASEYRLAHVAPGEIFRAAIAAGSPIGRRIEPIVAAGELVPDELTIELIRERLGTLDAPEGFVLDGFPRTVAQAEQLDRLLDELARPLSIVFEFRLAARSSAAGLVVTVRAERSVDEVWSQIRSALDRRR